MGRSTSFPISDESKLELEKFAEIGISSALLKLLKEGANGRTLLNLVKVYLRYASLAELNTLSIDDQHLYMKLFLAYRHWVKECAEE